MITFNWGNQSLANNIQNINALDHYRIITKKFCQLYYKTHDENYHELKGLYPDNCKITYLNKEYTSFKDVAYYLLIDDVKNFTHHTINVTSQPLSESTILITCDGTLTVNYNQTKHFIDTFILQNYNDTYYITNHIFKVIN